jgi:lipopolysaccharide/colanic/teichoic acid biosynthesis glycosyltransferase/glycosyltransferase involved in cell wall biosynthesis
MLGVVAARLARVPAVLYTIHGLPFASATGGRRALLKACELVSCRLAHRVLCVSGSMRSLALEARLTRADKLSVVANGSVAGIDADERFAPALHVAAAAAWRIAHGIPVDATVVTFIGRLTRDKGILELQRAWQRVRTLDAGAHLVMVGPLDSQEPAILDAVQRLGRDARVRLVGLEWNTAPILAASNLLVLPTYREGFPVTLLEAAAMALPVVASAVPGCTDAVKPGVTGTLVPVKDPDALASAIGSYLNDPASRAAHGATARAWVLRDFRPEVIWNETYAAYGAAVASPAGQRGGAGRWRSPLGTWTDMYRAIGKRGFDLIVASVALVVLTPVLMAVALLVRLVMGSPVFFRQARPGQAGRLFTLVKFRTMKCGRAGESDAVRLTAFGRLLRASSLDELPQLWNVIKGDMSIVGPRPLFVQYLDRYTPEQARRHEIRPGVTGLAQVRGRNSLDWEQKFAQDVWYVDHCSFALDVKILALTIWNVVCRRGISAPGHATAAEFMGSASR